MVWKISFKKSADKVFTKLPMPIRFRVLRYLDEVSKLDDPRMRGNALSANKKGLWRYRVGKYRVICDIQNDKIIILVVHVGKRDTVYD